jgi:hypothetical protein
VSRFDYEVSKKIAAGDPSFAGLIMAAYRRADTANARKIEQAWPDVVEELRARYHAPGGVLPGETVR